VVEARSYSRISGQTSLEMATAVSGRKRDRISRARRSCASLRYAWRKQTATASMPSPASRSPIRSTAPSSMGSSTEPSAATRSGTSSRQGRGTSGSGRSM
jgi:hypothetical protein